MAKKYNKLFKNRLAFTATPFQSYWKIILEQIQAAQLGHPLNELMDHAVRQH